jgi:type IV pilus assembly protein PilA
VSRFRDQSGFTLIELLVVVLIIGMLSAIALPNFLGESAKAQDASAQSNARNLAGQLESCFAENGTYTGSGNGGSCIAADTGLDLGSKAGQVRITKVSDTSYTVSAKSSSANVFKIVKDPKTGQLTRKCTGSGGGCRGKTW